MHYLTILSQSPQFFAATYSASGHGAPSRQFPFLAFAHPLVLNSIHFRQRLSCFSLPIHNFSQKYPSKYRRAIYWGAWIILKDHSVSLRLLLDRWKFWRSAWNLPAFVCCRLLDCGLRKMSKSSRSLLLVYSTRYYPSYFLFLRWLDRCTLKLCCCIFSDNHRTLSLILFVSDCWLGPISLRLSYLAFHWWFWAIHLFSSPDRTIHPRHRNCKWDGPVDHTIYTFDEILYRNVPKYWCI